MFVGVVHNLLMVVEEAESAEGVRDATNGSLRVPGGGGGYQPRASLLAKIRSPLNLFPAEVDT